MLEPLAIVGLGCRFPGEVDSPAALSSLLAEKRSAIGDVPADRWNAAEFYHPDFRKPGSIHVKRGGFLSRVDEFDAAFFGISPNEAKRMDPQQRHVLETAFAAICDAGLRIEDLAGKNIACIIGAGSQRLREPRPRAQRSREYHRDDQPRRGAEHHLEPCRLHVRSPRAELHRRHGLLVIADRAPLRLPCDLGRRGRRGNRRRGQLDPGARDDHGLQQGRVPVSRRRVSRLLRRRERVRPQRGVGAAFVKPLSRALADGDRVYALIRGTWINQDGRTSGMTVPSVEAQEHLLRGALREAGVHQARSRTSKRTGRGRPPGIRSKRTRSARWSGGAPAGATPASSAR